MLPVLSKWLEMVKDVDITIDEDDINEEAVKNWWSFSPTEEEEEGITAEAVAEFVQAVIENCREVLAEPPPDPMFFYCWHDFVDRTLNFSLVSTSHGRLPFGSIIVETDDLLLITTRVVMLDWLHPAYYTPADPEKDEEDGEKDEEKPFILPVFVTRLP
jgi:hypothetical protein